ETSASASFASAALYRESASRQLERSDARRVGRRALLHVVADVPDRAVVRWIDGGLRVVLPAHRGLRRLAVDQHRLVERQLTGRIGRQPRRDALTREARRAAE